MNNARVGEATAIKQASFYLLLTKAEVTGATETPTKNTNGSSSTAHTKPRHRSVAVKVPAPTPHAQPQSSLFPALHIDIQIHIAPDTPPEQIDRIFESMAKHLHHIKGNKAE